MQLTAAERMQLMKFVCSFAWTDLQVTQAERDLVMRICGRLNLGDAEVRQVAAWLETPPEDVDPTTVPDAHRELFLSAAQMIAQADGQIVPAERDALRLFRDLMRV